MSVEIVNSGSKLILPTTNVDTVNTNSIKINGLSSGFVVSNEGTLTTGTIGINDVYGLQNELDLIDASINLLSEANSSFITLDQTTNLIQSYDNINITNFANNWYQLNNAPTDNGVGVACSYNGQYILKLGWGASSYLSNDFGNTWRQVTELGSYQWSASISTNGQYILVSSQISTNYGLTWNYISSVGTPNDCKVSPTGRYMIIASNTGIYYSTNFGVTFTNWTDSGTNSWTSVAISSDGSSAVAVRGTSPATVWKTTNYGVSWSKIYNNPSSVAFGSIACSSDIKYILLALTQGTSGNMYLSSNYGASFNLLDVSNGVGSGNYFKVAISSSGMYMVAASNSGYVNVSKNYGINWVQTPLASTNYYGVSMSENANLVYVYAPNTKVYCFNANILSITTTQPNNPGQGSVYFDETTNKLYIYNSTTSIWKSVTMS